MSCLHIPKMHTEISEVNWPIKYVFIIIIIIITIRCL